MTLVNEPEAQPGRRRGLTALLGKRSVRLAAVGWVACNTLVLAVAGDGLPFDWPSAAARTPLGRVVDANLALLEVLLLTALTYWLSRKRTMPDLAGRAPRRSAAARETLFLLLYGTAGLGLGFVLARLAGWHPFGLHLAGSIYGTHDHVSPAEAIAWASFNLVIYAVVPLLYFRRRYSAEALNLRSGNRRADTILIGVILGVESLVPTLPPTHRLDRHHGHTRWAHLHRAACLGRVDDLRVTGQCRPIGGLPAPDLLRAGNVQDRTHRPNRQRLGPRLGLPRLSASHPRRYPTPGPRLSPQIVARAEAWFALHGSPAQEIHYSSRSAQAIDRQNLTTDR